MVVRLSNLSQTELHSIVEGINGRTYLPVAGERQGSMLRLAINGALLPPAKPHWDPAERWAPEIPATFDYAEYLMVNWQLTAPFSKCVVAAWTSSHYVVADVAETERPGERPSIRCFGLGEVLSHASKPVQVTGTSSACDDPKKLEGAIRQYQGVVKQMNNLYNRSVIWSAEEAARVLFRLTEVFTLCGLHDGYSFPLAMDGVRYAYSDPRVV